MRIALEKAKHGDLVKFYPISRKGEAIRFADAVIGGWRDGEGSASRYSHDAIYDRYEDGQHWLFESDGVGVQHSVLLVELANFDVYRLPAKARRNLRSRAELSALCNRRRYDVATLVKILWYYVTGTGGRRQQDVRDFYCSELANWYTRFTLVPERFATPRTTGLAVGAFA